MRNKKDWLQQVLKVLVLTVTFSLLYYFGSNFFILRENKTLAETENYIVPHKFNLSQNRLALVEFVKLDALSTNFSSDHNETLTAIRETNEAGLDLLAKENKLTKQSGNPKEIRQFIDQELPSLEENYESIMKSQTELLKTLMKYHSQVVDLFQYNANQDLNEKMEASEIMARSKVVAKSIVRVEANFNTYHFPMLDLSELMDALSDAEQNALILEQVSESDQTDKIAKVINDFKESFDRLRLTAFKYEKEILTTPEAIELLKDETNLLDKYQYWHQKIDYYQAITG